MRIYLELPSSGGRAGKFFAVSVQGALITVHHGELGTPGTHITRDFAIAPVAQIEAERMIRSRLRKGYDKPVSTRRHGLR